MLRLFLLFLALNFIFDIQAQKDIEQKKRADNYFQNQQYSTAINEYRQLLAQNQKNMEINFKYAACLFHTDDIKLSTRYFDLILNQTEVPVDAYYYRAKIYQHQYNFTKAIQLFTKYLELKPKKEQSFDAQTEINFCKQAKNAIGQPSSLKILARSVSPGIDFYKHYVFTSKTYSFYSIDDVFEKQNAKNNFKPAYAFLRGMRYRIFASYNDNSESGKDLFIQKKDEKGEWGKPVRLCPEINSIADEDFPFFDEVDGYLYFSSRGHGSIGGYDLFKVKYNLNENTCSELVNLGFPYSSPNDDYFFIPDYGTPNALFATNRNGNIAKIEIVKVEKELKKVEMLFVKGVFSDLIDSQNTDLEITVKHKETGETFGPIYSSKEGKYLICLPKDGVYTFQSKVTGSLTVFTKDVEITIPPKGKQFSQEIKDEMINSKEELGKVILAKNCAPDST
jgi:tetratricopeptide (TPR) repeat protein